MQRIFGAKGKLFLSVLLIELFVVGCSWQPKMFHPTVSQTGKVLGSGQTELGIYTYLYLPANFVLARGFGQGFEIRGALGLVGSDIGGGELTLIKRISQGKKLFTSGSVALEIFGAKQHSFGGIRMSGGYGLGFYPKSWFALYIPLRFDLLFYDWEGKKTIGAAVLPGLGLSLEGKHFIFRIAGNVPLPSMVGKVMLLPYLGAQTSFRW